MFLDSEKNCHWKFKWGPMCLNMSDIFPGLTEILFIHKRAFKGISEEKLEMLPLSRWFYAWLGPLAENPESGKKSFSSDPALWATILHKSAKKCKSSPFRHCREIRRRHARDLRDKDFINPIVHKVPHIPRKCELQQKRRKYGTCRFKGSKVLLQFSHRKAMFCPSKSKGDQDLVTNLQVRSKIFPFLEVFGCTRTVTHQENQYIVWFCQSNN